MEASLATRKEPAVAVEADDAADAAPVPQDHAGDPNFMTSLERGLQVIRAFSEHRRNLTISQISQTTSLSRAAVRRCLYTLKQLGYVGEESKLFHLRPQILTLGHAYLSSTPLAVSAQPYLDAVSQAVHESCSAAILDGDDIVYICRAAATRIMSINLLVGTRLPAYCTSMGQVLLAFLPGAELEAYLARVRLVARTEHTITTIPKLRKVLAKVREAGYSLLDQELEIGLRSIAVPIHDSRHRVVAAMNIGAQAARVSAETMRDSYLPVLQASARDLGSVLLG